MKDEELHRILRKVVLTEISCRSPEDNKCSDCGRKVVNSDDMKDVMRVVANLLADFIEALAVIDATGAETVHLPDDIIGNSPLGTKVNVGMYHH